MSASPSGGTSDRDDVFTRFNRHQGMGSVRDPYPDWAELRRRGPVQPMEPGRLVGRPGEGVPGVPPRMVAVLGFDAVVEVLRDAERFSSAGYAQTIGLVMGPTILQMDPPEHGPHRALLQPAFGRAALARLEHERVVPEVRARLDRIVAAGRADLVRDLAFPFPVAVVAGMIGLPDEDREAFHRLAVELISVAFDPARGIAASQGLHALFARHLAAARRTPRDDLLGRLARARIGGAPLDDEAAISFLRLLAPAGVETTYRSTSNLLLGLLTHPDQLEAVRLERRRIPDAIEEALRWECPLTLVFRVATRDTTLAGVPIAAGTGVAVCLAAANRDPARWHDPDRFDVFRARRPHAAFAFGPHTCLGMHLARMEMRVALEAVLDRLPGLRLDPEARDVHVTGYTFRTPLALPVVFDARA